MHANHHMQIYRISIYLKIFETAAMKSSLLFINRLKPKS